MAALGLIVVSLSSPARALTPRVFSLDQCADQYVIALAPRSSIVGVSPRVGDADSYLRARAAGLPRRRATAESVLAALPDLVVRYWGGDARLDAVLAKRRVKVVRIEEAEGFDGVRANLRRVATALGQAPRGEALIARLDAQLKAGRGTWGGRSGFYLTPGGFTAGKGTLIDAMLAGAGLTGAAAPGYAAAPTEKLVLNPPDRMVLGFFDGPAARSAAWGPGRQSVLRKLAAGRTAASLPGSILGCPAWFIGDGVEALAQRAPR
ncbi:ABC transporter substrate-binding protein [Phenylobacterium montanum]|uniref:ABC transporter substrate-binding protein n=1 Tax=Phenylobacterium montanum TaxID=2823693 RepID=A0A975G3W6_9CAUL|nr:ABC transporter substrate-binding protein [Caulobacter sp. S6]